MSIVACNLKIRTCTAKLVKRWLYSYDKFCSTQAVEPSLIKYILSKDINTLSNNGKVLMKISTSLARLDLLVSESNVG